MVFESMGSELENIKKYPLDESVEKHIFVSGARVNKLIIVKDVFQAECFKKLFYNDVFNMAIEYFIRSLDKMNDEDALELLKELYKDTRL